MIIIPIIGSIILSLLKENKIKRIAIITTGINFLISIYM
jgi:NADH:ubiquinone oxidoreductase subunit 4 (subunit M)